MSNHYDEILLEDARREFVREYGYWLDVPIRIRARIKDKWGTINYLTEKEVSEFKYDEVQLKKYAYPLRVRIGDKWGIIDYFGGGEICEVKYDDCYCFRHGNPVVVRIGNKWGFVDRYTAKEVSEIKYDEVDNLLGKGHLASVRIGNKWGAVDYDTGKEICEIKYDKVGEFFGRMVPPWFAVVQVGNKKGLIDFNGKEICEIKYDDVKLEIDWHDFFEVCIGDKWGFIDENGKEICEIKYDATRKFRCGYGAVCIGDKWGFIDENGKEICEIKYRIVHDFARQGFTKVQEFKKVLKLVGNWQLVEVGNWQLMDRAGRTYNLEPDGDDRDKEVAIVEGHVISVRWGWSIQIDGDDGY